MQFYMAPLEGITGYVWRNAYQKHFEPFDRYFTPFLAPTRKAALSTKEKNDVLPANNSGMPVIPQILSNHSKLFILCAKKLYQDSGYTEVNLNLGCPSGTVVTKKKGAGFLAVPDQLNQFLDEIYREPDMPAISIKTRLGMEDTEEFQRILDIYNRYPLAELIIHPRLQKELYKGSVHLEAFQLAVERSNATLCYNGDITDLTSYETVVREFPEVKRVMIGRGVLQNPFLLEKLKQGENPLGEVSAISQEKDKERLRQFHDDVLQGYVAIMPGELPTLFKMKELWLYLMKSFEFGADKEKVEKKIKKAGTVTEYVAAVDYVFRYPLKTRG